LGLAVNQYLPNLYSVQYALQIFPMDLRWKSDRVFEHLEPEKQ
jgi:hypothetical protein